VSGAEYLPSLDAGAVAYTDVVAKNGSVAAADTAAQKAMSATDAKSNYKDPVKTPEVKHHDPD
jgi:hypothetical protein